MDTQDYLAELSQLHTAVKAVVSPLYAVGGCVRDALMGTPSSDYDFTTPLDPDAIEGAVRAFGRHPYVVGKRFGTIGFKLEGRFIEVTAFRTESYSAGSRKPNVVFVDDLETDLSRRDFTINALAFDGQDIIDPFGGRSDLDSRLLRAVGDAPERLREDPLRILRASRFASQLTFSLDESLLAAMSAQWADLALVSRERWARELDKLMGGADPARGLDILRTTGALQLILPEVAHLDDSPWHKVMQAVTRCGVDLTDERGTGGCATGERAIGDSDMGKRDIDIGDRDAITAQRFATLLLESALTTGLPLPSAYVVARENGRRMALGLRWSKARMQELDELLSTKQYPY